VYILNSICDKEESLSNSFINFHMSIVIYSIRNVCRKKCLSYSILPEIILHVLLTFMPISYHCRSMHVLFILNIIFS
jgi:hypothetical protein